MMNSSPTITEYSAHLLDQCQTLLYTNDRNMDIDKNQVQSIYESAQLLVRALDIPNKERSKLLKKLETNNIKSLLLDIKDICLQVTQHERPDLFNFCREEERITKQQQQQQQQQLDNEWPDQIDKKAYWFRKYFVGKPYITLIGPFLENDNEFAIFSIVKQVVSKTLSQFRIIVRTKQDTNMGFIVNEKDAHEMIQQLEFLNQAYLLEIESKRHRPLRSFSSAIITGMTHQHSLSHEPSPSKLMRASLLFLFQEINFKLFKEFSAETTIMLGLEKEFLKYDEIGIPKSYKFGVLTVQEGQETEEEWFANSDLSIEFCKFLNVIGRPVKLKDYKGFAAGLDTKTGESGELSFATSWRDHEIMFHIAPLMPARDNDTQQIHRKRHIGNDIVCIVFVEGKNHTFNPNTVRSQFLHVFIVVYFEVIGNQDTWRVEVIHDKRVKPFSPSIPSPPLFHTEKDLRNFLILKLINAENASLKSSKFSVPNNKARLCILKSLIETGLDANHHQVTRYNTEKQHSGERPKSAGAPIRKDMATETSHHHHRPITPPVPSISRSNVLREFKSLTRRKSSGQQYQRQHLPVSKTQQHVDELRQDCHIINEHEEKSSDEYLQVQSANSSSGIRYKAQNLVSSMIGRRNSRNGRHTISS